MEESHETLPTPVKIMETKFKKKKGLFGSLGLGIVSTPSIPVLRAHFKSHAIPKYSYLLGILALNMLITPINFSLLPSFTLHAPMHGHE
jgi:hypothetical protein